MARKNTSTHKRPMRNNDVMKAARKKTNAYRRRPKRKTN